MFAAHPDLRLSDAVGEIATAAAAVHTSVELTADSNRKQYVTWRRHGARVENATENRRERKNIKREGRQRTRGSGKGYGTGASVKPVANLPHLHHAFSGTAQFCRVQERMGSEATAGSTALRVAGEGGHQQ